MTTTIYFSDETRQDLMVTALEGGSNYWLELSSDDINDIKNKTDKSQSFSVRVYQYIKAGNSLKVYDAENPEDLLGEITMDSIKESEEKMFNDYFSHYANVKEESWDAETADVWLQIAVMNDIVFG